MSRPRYTSILMPRTQLSNPPARIAVHKGAEADATAFHSISLPKLPTRLRLSQLPFRFKPIVLVTA